MLKFKMFTERVVNGQEGLEDRVNDWIEKEKPKSIVQMSSTTINVASYTVHTVMIFYEPSKFNTHIGRPADSVMREAASSTQPSYLSCNPYPPDPVKEEGSNDQV